MGYLHASTIVSPPASGAHMAMICQAVNGRGECQPLPSGATPRGEAGAEGAAISGTSAGFQPLKPNSGHHKTESLLCLVSAQLGLLLLRVEITFAVYKFCVGDIPENLIEKIMHT